MAYKNLATRKASDAYQRDLIAARERKESYRGTCVVCGRKTSGCYGPGKAPKRCNRCQARLNGQSRIGMGHVQRAALALFTSDSRVLTYSDIRDALVLSDSHVSMLLYGKKSGLLSRGFVERVGRGRYRRVTA